MADVLVIADQKGPIPADFQFNAPAQGDVILFVSGSAWRTSSAGFAGFSVLLDGNQVGLTQMYINEPSSHHALPPVIIPMELTSGQHTLHLSPVNGDMSTDANDGFFVSMVY